VVELFEYEALVVGETIAHDASRAVRICGPVSNGDGFGFRLGLGLGIRVFVLRRCVLGDVIT
jgi:hypothetical protein